MANNNVTDVDRFEAIVQEMVETFRAKRYSMTLN